MVGYENANRTGTIRPATPDDASNLAEIRNAWSARDGGGQAEALGLLMDEVDFLDRFRIPHGEDYFCYVCQVDGEVLGYVVGGGSRDLDRKAYSEVYEIALRRHARASGVGETLLERAITNSDDAAFAGLLLSVPVHNLELRELALRVGMREEGPKVTSPQLLRFERLLPGSNSSRR